MSLYHALKCSDIVKRKSFESFGTVVDTGSTILFTYPGINLGYSLRLTLKDLMANDWEVQNVK